MNRRWYVLVTIIVVSSGCGGQPADPGDDDDDGSGDAALAPDADPFRPDGSVPSQDATPPFQFVRCESPEAPLPPLVEDRSVYQQDTLDVVTVDVTIEDLAGLADVNAGVEDAIVPCVFSDGTFTAPGTFKIRGGFSRENVQKNYKVEIAPDAGRWLGQKEINLNKHMTDLTRVRNKMAFDIFQTIPDLTSLRTRFVHMFVNGDDYGMYTWIEEPDKRFLESHGLDPDGSLYKPVLFHFQSIPPEISSVDELIDGLIDSKANRDTAKLLRMIEAVHDLDQDFDDVVARYFNSDNLLTWMAVNLLLNDIDSLTQNYILYSPSSCEGWYLQPWDYDGAWGFYAQLHPDDRPRRKAGLTTYWPSYLWKRFLQSPANVDAVEAKMVELSASLLNDEVTAQRLANYHDVVLPFIAAMPDLDNLPGVHGDDPLPQTGIDLWEGELARITSTVSRFTAEYTAVLERPMPVFVGDDIDPTSVELRWNRSFDLQEDPLTYDLQVSTTPSFQPGALLVDIQDTTEDEAYVQLPPGTYFWRVIIEDHKTADSWQEASDPYRQITVP
jgi:spore coat protein H